MAECKGERAWIIKIFVNIAYDISGSQWQGFGEARTFK